MGIIQHLSNLAGIRILRLSGHSLRTSHWWWYRGMIYHRNWSTAHRPCHFCIRNLIENVGVVIGNRIAKYTVRSWSVSTYCKKCCSSKAECDPSMNTASRTQRGFYKSRFVLPRRRWNTRSRGKYSWSAVHRSRRWGSFEMPDLGKWLDDTCLLHGI